VYAFEPSPVNCRLLTMSLVANAFHNVTLFPSAVSDVEELLLYDGIGSNGFVSPLPSAGDATALSSRTVVRSVRLDRVFDDGTRLDVLKIDVEGAEFRALSGATAVLGTHRPLIVSEFSPSALRTVSGVDPAAYLRLLVDLGYELGILRPDGPAALHGRDGAAVLDAHARADVDHLDLVAFDPARHRSLVE
jgi:FkbM family methyltransferase